VANSIFAYHLIGHFDFKLIFPLFKYPTMARLFTAMAVGGQKLGFYIFLSFPDL